MIDQKVSFISIL